MMCMWKHINRLHAGHFILLIQKSYIASLSGWVATHIYNTFWIGKQYGVYHIGMHTWASRVCNQNIGAAMLQNKLLIQDVFHIACKKQRIVNAICRRVSPCIFNSFLYILYTYHLFHITSHKVGNSACTCIKVVHQIGW